MTDVTATTTLGSVPDAEEAGQGTTGLAADGPARALPAGRIAQATRWLIVFRLALSVGAIAVILIGQFGMATWTQARPVYIIVVIACVLNFPYLILLKRAKRAHVQAVIQIAGDLLLVSLLVFYTGGIGSQFTFFYFGPILASSLVLSPRASLIFASLAVTLLSTVSIAYGLGIAPQQYLRAMASELEVRTAIAFHLSQALAFFLVSMLSARLARRLGAERILSEEILENIGQGLLVLGSDGSIEYANSELQHLLGLDPHDLIGRRPEEIFSSARLAPLRTALGQRDPLELEMELDGSTAGPLPIRVKTALLPGGPGSRTRHPRGRIVVFTDLTLQKRMEEVLRQAERSATVSSLAAAIAHELRNPLASIRGAVQEVRDSETLSDSRVQLMDIVLSESDRLDRIITDFLQFARMSEVVKVRCDLEEIARETVALLETREEARDTAVDFLPQGDIVCRADPDQLRQVFLNLGLNALESLERQRGRRVTIRIRPASYRLFTRESLRVSRIGEGDPPGFIIEFSDNGRGMDEETRRRAFDPFFTTREGGSGLGLAVASRIIQAHGGKIDLRSAPGSGTTIRLWLPAF